MLSPVHSLGPGARVCLWTQGCSKGCVGCISPELQTDGGSIADSTKLAQLIVGVASQGGCRGLTVSGGDPFEQAEELLLLLVNVRDSFDDILVYTGFTLAEINDGSAGEAGKECLSYIDVLIDGRYQRELNTPDCVLRGSSNQIIHFFNEEKKDVYTEYMKKGRIIETFRHKDSTIITGILNEEENI